MWKESSVSPGLESLIHHIFFSRSRKGSFFLRLLLSCHLGSEPLKVVAELVHPLLDVVAVKVTSLGHALAGNL